MTKKINSVIFNLISVLLEMKSGAKGSLHLQEITSGINRVVAVIAWSHSLPLSE